MIDQYGDDEGMWCARNLVTPFGYPHSLRSLVPAEDHGWTTDLYDFVHTGNLLRSLPLFIPVARHKKSHSLRRPA
jgi:hypothetical protein